MPAVSRLTRAVVVRGRHERPVALQRLERRALAADAQRERVLPPRALGGRAHDLQVRGRHAAVHRRVAAQVVARIGATIARQLSVTLIRDTASVTPRA